MEELLLPRAEEERRSDGGSYGGGRGARSSMWERLSSLLRGRQQLRRSVHAFFKKNGLLTLSVIAVVTGCTLGFMLRGTQLSTQVPAPRTWSRLDPGQLCSRSC